jgi:2-methylcitrate dehydratase PrpD
VHKKVTLDSFTAEALEDANVLSASEKVTYRIDENAARSDSVKGYTAIKLKNGETKSKNIEVVYGHPQNPIDAESLVAKFINCASYFGEKN